MKKRGHLRLVVSNDTPATVDVLMARYRQANEHRAKVRTPETVEAARLAYNNWVAAAYGPEEAAPLFIPRGKVWGIN